MMNVPLLALPGCSSEHDRPPPYPDQDAATPLIPSHDCDTDEDCAGSRCVEVRPGGFRVCEQVFPEVTECESDLDECCSTTDCDPGWRCYDLRDLPWNVPGEPYRAICVGDRCDSDQDCLDGQKCIAANTIGWPNRQCVSMLCETDADCPEDGVCAPVEDGCTGLVGAFQCVRPGGCRTNAECSSDQPPFGMGETYCSWGECSEVLAGTMCD